MTSSQSLCIKNAPFCIGVQDQPHNPSTLPDIYPMELVFDADIGRLCLSQSEDLDNLLSEAYTLGIEMGIPSDNSDLGKPYVDDFLDFIQLHAPDKGRILEIGAGVGYLSRRLIDLGWTVDSVEPGKGYEEHWLRHGVDVINDFFPCQQATGPYDVVVFYTVLEHINDTTAFLKNVQKVLAPRGKVILSVPDCTLEIEAGDPSMLVHEHYQYFTLPVIERTLAHAGLEGDVCTAKYGRSIYACVQTAATITKKIDLNSPDIVTLKKYISKVSKLRKKVFERVYHFAKQGSVGIFCPARALYLIPPKLSVRFFDDAPYLTTKYYPPFQSPIETRADLLATPTDTLLIMSRTFGATLSATLRQESSLSNTRILTISDLTESQN